MSSPFEMPPCTPPESVGGGADVAVGTGDERVVVLEAGETRAGEAAADLEALRRGQREHALREVGVEAVEDRLAETGRDVADDAFDDTAERVAVAAGLLDRGDHALGLGGRRAPRRRALDGRERDRRGVEVDVDVVRPAAPTRAPRRPRPCASSWRAIAPAATRAMVSRALERPPPRWSRTPYFAS